MWAGRDPGLSGQIGDRSGYFDDAVVSPGRKVHAFHGTAQHGFRFGRQRTECADLLASHRGVAMNRQSGESGLLCRPGRDDPEPDRCAALLGSLAVEFGKAERRNVHVQVDPVEHRTRDTVHVLVHGALRADAFPRRVPVISARAGIHRGYEHEVGRIFDRVFRPRYGHASFLHRLAQRFDQRAAELGQLVEKQNSVMREGYLSRLGRASAADQRDARGQVVRGSERALSDQSAACSDASGHRVDFRRLERLVERHRRP